MGIFDIFKSNKKNESPVIKIYAPVDGKVIDLEDVPDQAFSEKMIGDGCAILPTSDIFSAPIAGEFNIFNTGHAITFDVDGLEMLVHIGIDSVKLKGKHFEILNKSGKCNVGDKLLKCDIANLKNDIPSIATPIIINTMEAVKVIKVYSVGQNVKTGDLLMDIYLK